MKVHVSKGDTVRVVRGEDKGKEGKVIRVFLKTGRVLVEGPLPVVQKDERVIEVYLGRLDKAEAEAAA